MYDYICILNRNVIAKKVGERWRIERDGYRCRDEEQRTALLDVRPGFVEFFIWESTTNTGMQHTLERKNKLGPR